MQKRILVTGGSGFFGSIIKSELSKVGYDCVNIDLISDPSDVSAEKMVVADIRDRLAVSKVFAQYGPFYAVCHAAAQLAHDTYAFDYLWESNVEGTRNVAEACGEHGVRKFIFISTNCLWGKPLNRPVTEQDEPNPVDIYGRSKLEAEKLLSGYRDKLDITIFRSSTIIAPGRIGLLGILFDFILEGRKIPVVGNRNKPYQFINAYDYAAAIIIALEHPSSAGVFHVGSHDPTSLRDSYEYLIKKAGSKARVYSVPEGPTIAAMKLCYWLRISPLGPYHYSMIAEEFVFDTTHVEVTLGWKPTQTNQEMLYQAFDFYVRNKEVLEKSHASLPAHKRKSRQGIISLLRWIS